MKRISKLILGAATALFALVGCSKEFDTPSIPDYSYTDKATHTIAEFKKQYDTDFKEITENVVLRGVVNATDQSGNIYKKLYLQDETGGIELSLDMTSLYTYYKVGQEIFIECKGLYVGKYGGVLQVGYKYQKNGEWTVGRAPKEMALRHIFRNGTPTKEVKPIVVNSVTELDASMTDMLITINNIRFTNEGVATFAEKGAQYPTSQEFTDTKGKKAIVYTSSYARFAQEKLPKGKGPITAILSSYNGTWQLIIRDRNDIGTFDGSLPEPPKPPVYEGTATHTIAQFRALYNFDLKEITENIVIRGIVSSSDESGNIYKTIYIQDESGALPVKINTKELYKTYKEGQEIFIECKGLYAGKYGDVLQLGVLYQGGIGGLSGSETDKHFFFNNLPGAKVTPKIVEIANLDASMVNTLVTINGLTFTNGGTGKYAPGGNTSQELTDAAGNKIIVYTSSYAAFANTTLPTGKVNITAILSSFKGTWQLVLNNVTDVKQAN